MKKQIHPSIKAQIIRSAFILLAFTALAALPFALAQRQNSVKQSVPTFRGMTLPASKHASVPIGSITPMEGDYLVDLAALDIHPTAGPLPLRALSGDAGSPNGAAMGTGKAFMGVTTEVVNQNIATGAFGILSSGWTAGESVRLYFNGLLAATFAANADGVVAVNVGTGAGFGYLSIEEIGLTSGKDTGGVVQVAPTGPYLPGVAGAPHAINTTAAAHFYLYRHQLEIKTPPACSLTARRSIPQPAAP